MSNELGFMKGDMPEIRFSDAMPPDETAITRWPRYVIELPVSWRSKPAYGLRWLARLPLGCYELLHAAGALLLACNVTLRQLEEEGGVTWSMLFASGIPWLKRDWSP